jgi:hypothetical protein
VADVVAHDVAAERVSGVPGRLLFTEAVFKLLFLWIFKVKCTLWSKAMLKIAHPSTTFTKVGRGFMQGIEQERHAKLAKFSVPVNSKPTR